jgi:hypothetical protein
VLRGSKRAAILIFRLPRRSLVVFEVSQLSPVCRPIGLFRVRGRAGVNRVRFTGRVAGRALRPGTYELRARGRTRARVRVVILPRGAATASATEALGANTCPSATGSATASLAASTASPFASSSARGDAPAAETTGPVAAGVAGVSETEPPLNGDSPESGEERSAGGALGVFTPPDTAVGTLAFALLLAGIAAAILLLGAATLPQAAARDPRLAALVADRRLELALVGTMTLFLVTVAYLVVVN